MATNLENTTNSISNNMGETVGNLTHTEPMDVRYGWYGMFGTILFFQVLNKLVTYVGSPSFVHNKPNEFWKFRNLFISWVHAFIAGTWTLYSALAYPEYRQDLIAFVEPGAYALVTFTTGYFLYDTGDLIVNNRVLKQWEVAFHHAAVTSMFFYNMATSRCIGYNVYALMAEVNSFFLHTRKLLQMCHVRFDHWSYKINAVLNIVTFVVFRGLSLGTITMGMITPGERYRVSTIYWYTLCGSMFVMWGINPILFWRLLKNDFLRKDYQQVKTDDQGLKNGIANNNIKKID
ncbi:TLC domain-containing protein 2-like [Lineus longissimus]|uniref:TLC domain-containing protein 2-like n=1 Tax=Lineus longissimus TaxID=88925 RepID=UPI002B4C2545